MTPAELDQIIHRACTRKARYGRSVALVKAQEARARGERVSPYRCPFADVDDPRHWHLGHVPSIDSLHLLAAAIRAHRQGTAA